MAHSQSMALRHTRAVPLRQGVFRRQNGSLSFCVRIKYKVLRFRRNSEVEKKLKKGKKVTVLGAGNVGASIAFALAIKGLCSELLLIDINKPKAKGEAMDIMQGNAFCPSCDIRQ